jgi:hypothetical protein
MGFKFFRNELPSTLQLTSAGVNGYGHTNNEFCFQFDDEEPFVFSNTTGNLTFTITPTDGGNMEFTHNGRRFKIFARERLTNNVV